MGKQKAPEGRDATRGRYEDVPATKMVTALENLLAEVLDVGRRIEALEAELELVKVDVGNAISDGGHGTSGSYLEHPFS